MTLPDADRTSRASRLDPESYNADPDRMLLLKNGTIISVDPAVGNFARGDILIRGSRIASVGEGIETDAPSVDVGGMIVIPGFCDPHIHSWQGNLPRIIGNQLGDNLGISIGPDHPRANQCYSLVMHNTFSHLYRPEDIYIGTLMSLLAALNGGITTVCDNAHNTRSPEHSDASIEALFEAGLRGIHAYGRARVNVDLSRFPQDVYRLKSRYFSSEDQLRTLRLWVRGDDDAEIFDRVLDVRRDLDCWLSIDTGLGSKPVEELYRRGLFDGRESINHGNYMTEGQMRAVAEHGGTVNVCPRIETQFRYGNIPYQAWRDVGLKPAMSNDDPATYPINMFQEMRTLYNHQRAELFRAHSEGQSRLEKLATNAEMLEAATLRGAACCGLIDKVGSLTPGKEADIVLLDTDNLHLFPKHNAHCTVVQGGDPGLVEGVFVGGRLAKWQGRLVGVDFERLKRLLEASRNYLFEASAWTRPAVDFGD